ncbi:hypothetical protein TVAG_171820 [Trichomonas vaginalis G3]|uniref:Borealin N-terminal domain-containing protein n=1 Tax=Trichomonas vaginalis (strain ATCC PRA-98 / G3) TaxID=412133 RepID=A2EWA7_TRIV3|nr:Nbl1 / Borealin N terminal family [Trichomonas vaginalis G3]EAY03084.1 hypothetical protein TVAG_171820 [Trichomonas vaginalis G3]KAI5484803.1 Nbl1 / Borealin N terminal family [Trichomonas vaginalis G3]|eukprot:XP_001315307.1 hypothetical protein [Trichomonas vaginalis G3]
MQDPATALENFDKEVECRCSFIISHSENLVNNMLCALDLALMGIPEPVRNMPMKQLMSDYDGDIIKAAESYQCNENIDQQQKKNQHQKRRGRKPRSPNIPKL